MTMSNSQTAEQRVAACLQLSPKGEEMLKIVLQERLPEVAQKQWQDFDSRFRQCCIKETNGTVVFDDEAFAAFAEDSHGGLINRGVEIYNGCSKALAGLEGHDCRVLRCLAQIYLCAKMALKFK
jgi:hypothetical protein